MPNGIDLILADHGTVDDALRARSTRRATRPSIGQIVDALDARTTTPSTRRSTRSRAAARRRRR